jgi:hypothetical protein
MKMKAMTAALLNMGPPLAAALTIVCSARSSAMAAARPVRR